MGSCVHINEGHAETVISIQSRGGDQFVGLVALGGMLMPVLLGEMTLSRTLTYWGFPILLVALYVIWLFIGKQEIRISDKELRMQGKIGPLKFGAETMMQTASVRSVGMREHSYTAKGGRRVDRALVFSSNAGVIAKSWQLSRQDCEALLNGPFKRFAEVS